MAKHSVEEQILALAGVYQAAGLVHEISTMGQCATEPLEVLLKSLWIESPKTTLEIYGNKLCHLETGLRYFLAQQGAKHIHQIPHIVITKYAVALLVLAKKALANDSLMNEIFRGIDVSRSKVEHFGLTHENTFASLAKTYSDTISQLSPRILVRGSHGHLQNPKNANKIRSLLLAGIRSAVLWRQLGGNRWQLIFMRQKLMDTAAQLYEHMPTDCKPQVKTFDDKPPFNAA